MAYSIDYFHAAYSSDLTILWKKYHLQIGSTQRAFQAALYISDPE